ncbi:MAG TPA: hypothetical protein VIM60_01230 [Edaphobacter sp.]
MNQTQNSVDRILGALRDVQTPAGMEQRILNTLEAARFEARAKARRGSSVAVFRMPSLRWAAAVVLVLAGAAAWHGLTHTHPSTTAIVKQRAVSPSATGETAIAQRAVTITQPDHAQLNPAPRLAVRHDAASVSTLPQPQIAEPAAAAEENAMVSHPAPPIPPTRQERLLLEYARQGRTEDLAQVSNERRSAQEARDAAEFQEFFKPPVVIGESE